MCSHTHCDQTNCGAKSDYSGAASGLGYEIAEQNILKVVSVKCARRLDDGGGQGTFDSSALQGIFSTHIAIYLKYCMDLCIIIQNYVF